MAPYRNGDLTVMTLALGNSFVVFTPYTRLHLESPPLHYTETVIDAPTQKAGRLLGEPPPANAPIVTSESLVRRGENVYAIRRSIRFFNCVTAYTSFPQL